MKDLLCLETLIASCRFLPEERVFFFEECASTNAAAKEWVKAGHTGKALFAAAAQSAGRGRMGRTFYSPTGGVYFTAVQTLDGAPDPVGITCAAAVMTMRAIRDLCGLQCEIKWVNDLLYQGKKVCGILTEMVTCGEKSTVLVGIGVNLRPAVFPPDLAEIAGSLGDETTPRADLIAQIAERMFAYLEHPAPEQWLEEYRRHSCVLGKNIAFLREGAWTPATALAIAEDGGLLVRHDGKTEVLRTGEITLRMD